MPFLPVLLLLMVLPMHYAVVIVAARQIGSSRCR